MNEAVSIIRSSAATHSRCFLSTPNLNFLVACQNDPEFLHSVVNSDLSVADGMPLVWVAKMLRYPIYERVAGSDLFQKLRASPKSENPMSIFFFGGPDGIAEKACELLNVDSSCMTCAGYISPGFGSIEQISSADLLDEINRANPEFLLIALGAKKGQLWIERNRDKLAVPVVGHLGAVINFVAGTVRRAPVFFRNTGTEWIWRILQEPRLLKRYLFDGIAFTGLFLFRVFPYSLWLYFNRANMTATEPVGYRLRRTPGETSVELRGRCLVTSIDPLRPLFKGLAGESSSITLDLSSVQAIDGAFLGLCLVLYKHLWGKDLRLRFTGLNKSVRRVFYWSCVDYLLDPS